MCELLMFVNSDLAEEVGKNVGCALPEKPSLPPNAADPENNIVPANRSLQAATGSDRNLEPKVQLPKKSKALSILLNNPKEVRSRKVALLVSSETDDRNIETIKAALKKNRISAEVVIPQLSLGKDNEDGANVEKCEMRLIFSPK